MERVLSKISEDYHLNESDVFLMDYVLGHSDEVRQLSTHQLAKKTYSNATAVVRFVKKLGFNNYNDFKINIHHFLNEYYLKNMQLLSHENIVSIETKLSEIEKGIINQTKEMISVESLEKVIEMLSKSQYIDIVATDTNASLGEYASHLFFSTGRITNVYKDMDKQLWLSLNVKKNHTVIIISKHGKNQHLLKIVDILDKRNIPMIILTTNKEHALKDKGVALYGIIHDEFESLKDMIFYISIKYIFDLIYSILISENLPQAKELYQLYCSLLNDKVTM